MGCCGLKPLYGHGDLVGSDLYRRKLVSAVVTGGRRNRGVRAFVRQSHGSAANAATGSIGTHENSDRGGHGTGHLPGGRGPVGREPVPSRR